MKRAKPNREKPGKQGIWLFLAFLVVFYAVSAGVSYYFFRDKFTFESSYVGDIGPVQDGSLSEDMDEDPSRLYESRESSPVVSSGMVSGKDALLFAAEDSIKNNMKPYGVRLLDLYMDRDGVIYIDFGGELKKNFSGDAAKELNVIAGLYKGIKSAVPGFTAFKILIDGKEAESFGGHIDISRPIGEVIEESI